MKRLLRFRSLSARQRLQLATPTLLALVAILAASLAIVLLYQTSVKQEEAQLIGNVMRTRRLIETLDTLTQGDVSKTRAILDQANICSQWVRKSGEFAIARLDGDQISFLLTHRMDDYESPVSVPFKGDLAEPMRRALRGQTGHMVGPDYRGVSVLAAYTPVRRLHWGLVAKIDMSEIHAPFIRAGLYVLGLVSALIVAATCILVKVIQPVVVDLQRSKKAAEATNRAKSDFLAAMSHELRTPLNAIIGFSQGMLERTDRHPLTDHQKDRLCAIHKSGLHLLGLIDDVLDFAQVETGKVDVRIAICNARLILDDVHRTVMEWLHEKPNVVVQLDAPLDLPLMTTDGGKVRRILLNLAGNSVKFTERGSITLSARDEEDWIVFAVRDTGAGIPADLWPHVFDKHFQIRRSTSQSIKGTGLGLPIARAYAELLGGSISFTSQLGKGSTFTLRLPRRVTTNIEQEDEAALV
jgi:signal transduction histidine kinase